VNRLDPQTLVGVGRHLPCVRGTAAQGFNVCYFLSFSQRFGAFYSIALHLTGASEYQEACLQRESLVEAH